MVKDTEIPSLYAIGGTATDDVWAVGWDGSILHWDGKAWSHTKTGTDKPLGGVCAIARDDAWVFGMDGALLHWNGDTWTRHIAPKTTSFWRAWANSSDDVWAIVQPHHVVRWDGESWTDNRLDEINFGEQSKLLGIWGSGPNDVWLVGSQMLHWDGERFESHSTPEIYGTLEDAWGFGPRDVWAVGYHGMVARFDGDSWQRLPIPSERSLNAVWGTSSNDVWVGGERGALGHWNGRSRCSLASPRSWICRVLAPMRYGPSASMVRSCDALAARGWSSPATTGARQSRFADRSAGGCGITSARRAL